MHAVTWQSARAARRIPAQFIAGRRFPPRLRSFHRSARLCKPNGSPSEPRDPAAPSASEHDNEKGKQPANGTRPPPENGLLGPDSEIAAEAGEDSPAVLAEKLRKTREKTRLYQSALKRSSRNKQSEDFPPIHIPTRFLTRNVTIREERSSKKKRESLFDDAGYPAGRGPPKPETRGNLCLSSVGRHDVEEIARLSLPLPERLYQLLENTAREAAKEKSAPQYEEILEYINKVYSEGDVPPKNPEKMDLDAASRRSASLDKSLHFCMYLEVLAAISGSLGTANSEVGSSFPSAKSNLILHSPTEGGIQRLDRLVEDIAADLRADLIQLDSQDIAELVGDYLGDGTDPNSFSLRKPQTPRIPTSPQRTIILIKDYKELSVTRQGARVLDKITELVHNRRKDGSEIMIDIRSEDPVDFITSERRRNEQINARHIQDMIRRLDPSAKKIIDSRPLLQFSTLFPGIDWKSRVLAFHEVHRLIQTAIGLLRAASETSELDRDLVFMAGLLLRISDDVKFSWVAHERQKDREPKDAVAGASKVTPPKAPSDLKLEKIQKTANKHEKKLLTGVVNPSNIKTTFSDVHAAQETIDALKTMTSLSLLRPDAFSYGVLATDKIPGLLLYGPPGTGKTLLAKAVAKESGATVLEVSGSEIYDMYVGEGEKNVRAIFSLARKLSPCVVFIDEADAIFGSRSGSRHRTSHREVLNQFLKEWDGMNDLSVFIMVATNRPFDMDDAVLRRLPRRLLVDLPTQKDREEILRIHLKDEQLDPGIKLDELAAKTPFYSGSDLKNLCVAAALNCVREENEIAAAIRAGQEAGASAVTEESEDAGGMEIAKETEETLKSDEATETAGARTNEATEDDAATTEQAKEAVFAQLKENLKSPEPSDPEELARVIERDLGIHTSSSTSPSSTTHTSTSSSSSAASEAGSSLSPSSASLFPAKRTLLPHHFERAMQEISASISEDMASLSAIRKFDEQYGDKRGNRKKKSSWGFAVAGDMGPGEEAARVRPSSGL
ncbi:putative mitochondrial aaa protein [Neofusicoccum parvum UCRNP2]|uniref:Putative mitochondrial aaa protein n=1 Tax=Botryosphaeria parva (strain UCR-NP2) TaxID=1287680 RepID=R1EY07_BOTPV|nr:putative mitochondrial aaa protein [Neofusicoccum parvum UCRNP2]